jgi:hypothetical protein
MSLADLSSKLYTIKSRKNLPLSAAFVSMVREDLAMRYSVFNIVKSLTGSELIAQVAQSKYGKLTPQQQKEESENRKKATIERRFKKFTVDSLVTLNNKLNTLTSITERNTVLIENLYNDLGSFRTQRKFTKKDMNVSFVRAPLRSRTVKFQIDQLRAEMNALQLMTVGTRGRNKIKKNTRNSVVGGAAAGGAAAGATGTDDDTTTDDKGDGNSMLDNVLNAAEGLLFANQLRDWWKNRRPSPTATPEPTKPSPTTKPQPSTNKPQPKPRPTTATKPPSAPSRASRALGAVKGFGGRLFGALGTAGRILGTGPQIIATIVGGATYMASGAAAEDVVEKMQEKLRPFGIKVVPTKNGTVFEINGVTYTSENLPPEYQTIIDAFAIDSRSASSRAAQQRIQAAPALYNSLIVEGPPLFAESDTAMKVIAAAKAAQLNIPEPVMSGSAISTPEPTSIVPTLPSVSYTPGQPVGVETVKQIIVQAANIVGVDPGIMLAMGQQESTFNPNARPFDKKTGKLLSSAKGLFQFIDSTWKEMLKKYSNEYPELNRGPFDPMANALAGALYVKENSAYLRKNKIPITGTSIYATHFLGPGGATKLFGASRESLAVAVLPDAATSNPFIFKNKDGSSKTVGEVIDSLYFKVGRKAETFTAELRAKPPVLGYQAGISVSTPPIIEASTSSQPASTSSAEVTATAAIVTNQKVQQVVVGLNNKINDMDKKINADGAFPSVRNSANPA